MTEHTPGPWTLKEHRGKVYTDHGSDWLFGPDGKPIIHFHQADYDSEAWFEFDDANARLIASAPDLLAACKTAKAFLVPDLEEHGRTVFWTLVDAIAKATGPAT